MFWMCWLLSFWLGLHFFVWHTRTSGDHIKPICPTVRVDISILYMRYSSGNPLPPNIVQCGYCGYDNSPVQRNATNSFVQPGLGQWYPSSSDNSFPSAQPGGNGGLYGVNGQFPALGNNQSTPVPPAFYDAFPNQGQVNGFLPGFISPPQTPEVAQSVTVERRALNMKKVIGLVVILLVLIGGSIAGGYRLLASLQRTNNMTNVPSGYPIPKETPLFAETFTNNNRQWNMQSMQGRYLASIKKGSLILEDDNNKLFPILLPGDKNFSDFKLIVDTQLSKGDRQNGYGLCIRGATDPNGNLSAFYRLELYGNSTYAVFKVATDVNGNTSSTTLVEPIAHAAIHPAGHINQIVVIANGPKVTLIVNGQTVQTFSGTSYASGVVALFVSNLPDTHPGAQATFSHLAIYPVNAK